MLVLSLPLRGFSPGTPVSPSPKSGHRYCFEFLRARYSYHLGKSGAGYRNCLEISSARYHYHLKISTAGYRYYLEIPRAGYRYCLKDVFNNVARVTTSNKTKSKTINKQCIKKDRILQLDHINKPTKLLWYCLLSVSYTHLTLPTSDLV